MEVTYHSDKPLVEEITVIKREVAYHPTWILSFAIVFPGLATITLPFHVYEKEWQAFTKYSELNQVPPSTNMTSMNGFTLKKKGNVLVVCDFWTTIVEFSLNQSTEVYRRLKAL